MYDEKIALVTMFWTALPEQPLNYGNTIYGEPHGEQELIWASISPLFLSGNFIFP